MRVSKVIKETFYHWLWVTVVMYALYFLPCFRIVFKKACQFVTQLYNLFAGNKKYIIQMMLKPHTCINLRLQRRGCRSFPVSGFSTENTCRWRDVCLYYWDSGEPLCCWLRATCVCCTGLKGMSVGLVVHKSFPAPPRSDPHPAYPFTHTHRGTWRPAGLARLPSQSFLSSASLSFTLTYSTLN